jgi:hypothetical protein
MTEQAYFTQFAGEDIESPIVNDFSKDYDWTANAIPTREFERELFRVMKAYTADSSNFVWAMESLSQKGSDEQWAIVCNTLEYLSYPDDFEDYLV